MRNKTANMKEYQRLYYLNNKEKFKNYYLKDKEKIIENAKMYYKNNKEKAQAKAKKISGDKNIYLIFDEKGTLLFKFPRWKIIKKLGVSNKKIDFAVSSGESVNGFLIDICC